MVNRDSPRWCDVCQGYGEHHTDRHGWKALTLRQPWATLIALGAKNIETRSWSTKYRGPLAIHAGKTCQTGLVGDYDVEDDSIRGGGKQFMLRSDRMSWPYRLPLGAVTATCTLVDVLPIHLQYCRCPLPRTGNYVSLGLGGLGREILGVYRPDGLAFDSCNGNANEHPWVAGLKDSWQDDLISRNIPYGEYRCGRYAWLLSNVSRVDPVPVKGRQGLWNWEGWRHNWRMNP